MAIPWPPRPIPRRVFGNPAKFTAEWRLPGGGGAARPGGDALASRQDPTSRRDPAPGPIEAQTSRRRKLQVARAKMMAPQNTA